MRRWATCVGALALGFLVAAPISNLRQLSVGHFALEIDGVNAGWVHSIDGGAVSAEVIEEEEQGTTIIRKVPGRPKWEDVELEAGMGMSAAFYEWIEGFLQGQAPRHDGRVVAFGSDLTAKKALEFHDAFLVKVRFPPLNGALKEPAFFEVTLAPEETQAVAGDGSKASSFGLQEKWLKSNFRFELGSLPCTRVSKVDSFVVKQQVVEDDTGETREPRKVPGKLEIPNLRLTISAVDLQPWAEWFNDFVIDGKNGQDDELQGKIVWLDPTLAELGHLDLKQVGIFRLDHFAPPDDGDPSPIATFVVDLYVEAMELHHGPSASPN